MAINAVAHESLVAYTYDHPKPLPDLASTAIHWEQSIVEGHATHPVSI